MPSRYDLAKLDTNIREELSLADPRVGGGDLSMTTMISEAIVDMLHEFCNAARRAISEVAEGNVVDPRSGSATDAMKHNLRVSNVIVSVKRLNCCRQYLVPHCCVPDCSGRKC